MSQGPIETAYVEVLPRISPTFGSDVTKGVTNSLSGLDARLNRSLSGVGKTIQEKVQKPLQETANSATKTGDVIGTSFEKGSRRAQDSIDRIDKHAKTVSERTSGAFAGVGGKIAGAFAVVGVGSLFKGFISDAANAQREAALTAQVIKTTGGAAGVTAGQVDKLSNSLALQTGIDDDTITRGQRLLLTFTGIRNEVGKGNDVFTQATKISADLSASLGQDMQSSVIQVGKALNDPIKGVTALQRVGVSFTASQKKQIKTLQESGNTLGAQKLILGELQKEFGGAAAAGATSGQKISVAFHQIGQTIGTALLPVVDKVAVAVIKLTPLIETGIGKISKVAGPAFAKIADTAGPALAKLSSFIAGLDLGDRIRAGIKALQPTIVALTTAVQRLIPVIKDGLNKYLHNAAELFQKAVIPAARQVAAFLTSTLLPAVQALAKSFAKNVVPVIQALVHVFVNNLQPALISLAQKFDQHVLPVLIRFTKIILAILVPVTKLALAILGKLLPPLLRLVGPILGTAIKVIGTVIGAVFDFIGAILNLGNTVSEAGGLFGKFVEFVGAQLLRLVTFYADVWVTIGKVVVAGVEAVVGFIKALPGKAVAALANLGQLLGGAIATAFRFVLHAEATYIETIVNLIKSLPGRLASALGSLGSLLAGVIASAFRFVLNAEGKYLDGIVNLIKSLPGRILSIDEKMAAAGRKLISSLFTGIKNAARGAGGFAVDIASAIKNALNDLLNLPLKIGPIKALGKTVVPRITLLPRFAWGGVFDKATFGVFGEAGREAIVPATRSMGARAAQVIAQAGLLDIPQVQAMIRNRFLTDAIPTSQGVRPNPLNNVARSSTTNNTRNVKVDAHFNLAPMGDPAQHARQVAVRLAELMER